MIGIITVVVLLLILFGIIGVLCFVIMIFNSIHEIELDEYMKHDSGNIINS